MRHSFYFFCFNYFLHFTFLLQYATYSVCICIFVYVCHNCVHILADGGSDSIYSCLLIKRIQKIADISPTDVAIHSLYAP